jgi:hypothetical protein
MLNGSGLIEGAAACHVSVDGVQLRPVLRAESRFEGPRVQLFVPQLPGLRERTDFKAIRGFVRTPFFRALSDDNSAPIPWDNWRALMDTASRLDHGTPSAWYHTIWVSAATALGVCLLYHLGCRFAPQWVWSLWGGSAAPLTNSAGTPSDAQVESTCSTDNISMCGAVSPSPAERFVKYPK